MNHPQPEVLLQFAEGQDVTSEAAAHFAACTECQAQLAELGRFETHLAAESTMSEHGRQALRTITARTLTTPRQEVRPHRWVALVAVAVAAGLATVMMLWSPAGGLRQISVHRYVPDNVVRAERLERFSLDVQFDAPRWVSLWQINGKTTRLMPNADPLLRYLGAEMPLAAGRHRMPAAEVLDFEFAASSSPSALVLVATTTELGENDLVAIEKLIAETSRAKLSITLQTLWPEARVLDFPAK